MRRTAALLNDTRTDRHHGCDAVIAAIHQLAADADIDIVAHAPARSDWRDDPALSDAIDAADLIIVNGEGTIHHDSRGARRLMAAAGYARSRNKKCALINATWAANGPELLDQAKAFDLVFVRESRSAEALLAGGVFSEVVPDLALFWQAPDHEGDRLGIGYTDNAVRPRGLDIYQRMRRLGGEPLSLFHDRSVGFGIDALRTFLPNPDARRDIRRVLAAVGGVWVDYVSQKPSREALMAAIAAKRLVVTGRFHVLIFCIATRTPFLAIESNTPKLSATVADCGAGTWRCVTPDMLCGELIDRASLWTETETLEIGQYVKAGRLKMADMFSAIAALA